MFTTLLKISVLAVILKDVSANCLNCVSCQQKQMANLNERMNQMINALYSSSLLASLQNLNSGNTTPCTPPTTPCVPQTPPPTNCAPESELPKHIYDEYFSLIPYPSLPSSPAPCPSPPLYTYQTSQVSASPCSINQASTTPYPYSLPQSQCSPCSSSSYATTSPYTVPSTSPYPATSTYQYPIPSAPVQTPCQSAYQLPQQPQKPIEISYEQYLQLVASQKPEVNQPVTPQISYNQAPNYGVPSQYSYPHTPAYTQSACPATSTAVATASYY